MNALATRALEQAKAEIERRTDPRNPDNVARARRFRMERRTARRAFVTDCLNDPYGYWTALNWLSGGFESRFLSMDEAVQRIRGMMNRYRLNHAAGREYRTATIAYSELRFRLPVAIYFARYGRDLWARDMKDAA